MKRAIFYVTIVVIVLWGLAQPIGAKRAAPRSDWTIYLPLIARAKENPLHTGIATYYDATGAGACGFDPSPNDLMVTAHERRRIQQRGLLRRLRAGRRRQRQRHRAHRRSVPGVPKPGISI